MNKLRLLKITLALVAVLAVATIFTLGIIASPTVKVTYSYGDFVYNQFVEAGHSFDTYTPTLSNGDIFYGWVNNKGTLYTAGKKATVTADTTLYLVAGCEVSSAEELVKAVADGKTYVKLTKSFSLAEQLVLNRGVFVIDTNGYTLSIDSLGDGIVGTDTGIVFTGNGKIVHEDNSAASGIITTGFVRLCPTTSFNTLFITVDRHVTVNTNVDFISIASNISNNDGAFTASVYGALACNRFMRTQGISNAAFTVYEGAKISTGCEYLFEDIGTAKVERLVNLTILGGQFNLNKLNGYAYDHAKYQAAIVGGSFSCDITNCFPDRNYHFERDTKTGYYKLSQTNPCDHNGPVVGGIPQTCTEAATLTYKCVYCNTEYTKDFPQGIGHTIVTAIEQPMINTEELTQEGIYKHYCQKCDEMTTYETFYPRPSEAYVSVVVIDIRGNEKTLRIPANELYTFDSTNTTQANSFSTEYIQYNFNITQEHIISVEVPLGTTDIHGGFSHDSGVGLFCENPHLQEVILPKSLVNVQKYAFHNMPKLKTIKGLEHITGTIGERAFSQNHANAFIDHMVINAKTINNYAFNNIRMNALTLGSNVYTISHGAFRLDAGLTPVKEVFVEGNDTEFPNGLTVSSVLTTIVKKNYSSGDQQFGNRAIVFTEHQCEVTVYESTCYSKGYSHHICKNCSYERKDSETPQLTHDFQNIHVPPTCLTQGYTVDKCLNCGDEIANTKVVSEKRDPNAHDYTYGKGPVFVDISNGSLLESGSVCINYHCLVGKCKCGALNYSEANNSSIVSPYGSHHYDETKMTIIKEPNCGEYGIAEFACTVCSNKIQGDLPLTGANHKWDSGTVIVAPTCTDTGIKEFRCTICNSESGIKQSKLSKDASNHDWDKGVVEREPTEMVSGVLRITCKRCGYDFTEGINKLEASKELPTWAIVLIAVGGVLLAGGIVLTFYFTFFKKKRASDGYKYKFNTLGK